MQVHNLLDLLLERRSLSVSVENKTAADNLRVTLLRRFNNYKVQMNDLGFLDPELEPFVLSLEWHEQQKVATFFLRERKTKALNYTLVDTPES